MTDLRILGNTDARLKGLRFLQFGTLFLSQYLEPEGGRFGGRLKEISYNIQESRRMLRIFYGIFNLRKIITYKDKDSKSFLRSLYLLSKLSAFAYFCFDTMKVYVKHFSRNPEKRILGLNKYGYRFFLLALSSSTVYYFSYLVISYLQESKFSSLPVEGLKPYQILAIIKDLSAERKTLLLNLFANLLDILIGMKYSGLIEKIFNTRINDLSFGMVGMVCSCLRIWLAVNKNKLYNREHLIFEQETEFFEDYN